MSPLHCLAVAWTHLARGVLRVFPPALACRIIRQSTVHLPYSLGQPLIGQLSPYVDGRHPASVVVRAKAGFQMELDLRDRWLQRYVYFLGVWEPDTVRLLRSRLNRGYTVLDLGANVGYLTLVAAQAVGPEGHVYAFEPVPELFSALKRNVELNGFRNVTCVRAAVTDRSGEVAIEDTSSLPSKAGATLLARSPDMPMINVPAVTIDGFSCEHELTKVDFVKMDIEGSEVLALRGMSKLLSGPQGPDVLCEVTDSLLKRMGSGGEELCRFLINLGYAPYKPVYHRLERTSTNGERITLPSNLGENYFFSKDHNLK